MRTPPKFSSTAIEPPSVSEWSVVREMNKLEEPGGARILDTGRDGGLEVDAGSDEAFPVPVLYLQAGHHRVPAPAEQSADAAGMAVSTRRTPAGERA